MSAAGYNMQQEAGFRGETAPMSSLDARGRRYIECPTQMDHAGVSTAQALRQGRGRRGIPQDDHRGVTAPQPEEADGWATPAGRARRTFHEADQVRDQVFGAAKPYHLGDKADSAMEELKQEVYLCMAQAHGMEVYDRSRWAQVTLEQNGCTWKLEATTDHGLCLCREGRSMKIIAEKMAMLGGQDMKHFGVRCSSSRPATGSPLKDSPTMASQGVHTAIGGEAERSGPNHSCRGKDPKEQSKRYIGTAHADHLGATGTDDTAPFRGRRQVSTARQSNALW